MPAPLLTHSSRRARLTVKVSGEDRPSQSSFEFACVTLTQHMASSGEVCTNWEASAGDFSCLVCRRKRLSALHFSKAQIQKAFASEDMFATCKECVQSAQLAEQVSASARITDAAGSATSPLLLLCSKCHETLPEIKFSRSQGNNIKHQRPGACKTCIEKKLSEERAKVQEQQAPNQAASLKKTKTKTGVVGRLVAACAEAAVEGEQVTGLRAVRGRGRGSWRTRGARGRR